MSARDIDQVIAARDFLEAMIEAALEGGQWDAVLSDQALEQWAVLEKARSNGPFRALQAKLPWGEVRELRRALRAAAAAFAGAATAPDAAAEDWPGNGSVSEYLTEPAPPVREFVRGRLLANRAHGLVGLGGSSKTRLLYHCGMAAAVGRFPWDWPVERIGTAALLLAEDACEGVHRTVAGMAEAMRLSEEERALVGERLHVYPLAGRNSRLLASVAGDLVETGLVDALMRTLRELPPPLVFVGLDPALALTEGDELNQAHQRRLGELVDRIALELDACVLLAAHAGKSLQNSIEIGSHSARGAGALTDALRAEFVLRTMTADEARGFGIDSIEERKAHVQLIATKGNELPPAAFAPLWLRRASGGVLEAADLVERSAPTVGPREVRALEILRDLAAVSAPRLGVWREACSKAGVLTGANDRAREKSMDRMRDALLAAGLIEPGTSRGFYVPKVSE